MEEGSFLRKNEEEEPGEYEQSIHDRMLERRMGLELGFCGGFSVCACVCVERERALVSSFESECFENVFIIQVCLN